MVSGEDFPKKTNPMINLSINPSIHLCHISIYAYIYIYISIYASDLSIDRYKKPTSSQPQRCRKTRSTRSLNLDEVLRSEFRAAYVVEELRLLVIYQPAIW